MLRRSERLAIKDSMHFAREHRSHSPEPEPEPAAAEDPHAPERNRIIRLLADCKSPCCVSVTKHIHEASCEWCRTHPEWRMITHNMTIQIETFEKLRTKQAKRSAALGIVSYINDNAIDFAKAHEKFKMTVINRCEHFIAEATDCALLRLVSSDVIRKLRA